MIATDIFEFFTVLILTVIGFGLFSGGMLEVATEYKYSDNPEHARVIGGICSVWGLLTFAWGLWSLGATFGT